MDKSDSSSELWPVWVSVGPQVNSGVVRLQSKCKQTIQLTEDRKWTEERKWTKDWNRTKKRWISVFHPGGGFSEVIAALKRIKTKWRCEIFVIPWTNRVPWTILRHWCPYLQNAGPGCSLHQHVMRSHGEQMEENSRFTDAPASQRVSKLLGRCKILPLH